MATKYWVNIDGIQSGPISRDELADMDFNPEVTYVWHQELDDWHRIDQLSEFADIVAGKSVQQSVTPPPVPSESEMPIVPPVPPVPSEPEEPIVPPVPSVPEISPMLEPSAPPVPPVPAPSEAEAPTNLVWAVIVTVMCCQITGIIAIVYGVMTSTANSAGNYEKARHYSDIAQIWVMVSIALGLVYMPVALLMMML
ncbi:MAG: CD225/dispanin family protein [Muribaculaceae bacterium]